MAGFTINSEEITLKIIQNVSNINELNKSLYEKEISFGDYLRDLGKILTKEK